MTDTEECSECGKSFESKNGAEMCEDCEADAGEAAWEQHCSNFYGGSDPYTIAEICDAARKIGR